MFLAPVRERGEQLVHAFELALDFGLGAGLSAQAQVFIDGQVPKDATAFRAVRNAAPDTSVRRQLAQGLSVQLDAAAAQGLQARDGFEQGGFARAVAAHQRHQLPWHDLQAHAVQALDVAVPAVDAAQAQQRLSARGAGSIWNRLRHG
jgi:hypothetical protein